MKFRGFGKIRKIEDTLFEVEHISNFKGIDENGEPIIEKAETLPTLEFTGTIKIHGTNAAIVYTPEDGLRCQSRNNLLSDDYTSTKMHYGFNHFVLFQFRDYFEDLMKKLHSLYGGEQITLYGEWAGAGVQDNVGVSQLKKKFYVFDCVVLEDKEHGIERKINIKDWRFNNRKVFNIYEFPVYKYEVDFNNIEKAKKEIAILVDEIEKQCPVAKYFGKDGIGEGIVWRANWRNNHLKFKSKGELHKVTNKKVIKANTFSEEEKSLI